MNIPLTLFDLLSGSKTHHNYPIYAIHANFIESIRVGNFRIYLQDGLVVGFVNWTFLTSSEINSVIKAGGVMGAGHWRSMPISGANLYIPELVAKDSIFKMIHSDLEVMFPVESVAYGLSWKNNEPAMLPRIRKIKNRRREMKVENKVFD